ncbi:MAG: right-handed parallel beta-helix repeat-containing protein [Thermodesulfobacteriota bacterium]
MHRTHPLVAAIAAVLVLGATDARAADLDVAPGGSIQAAIAAAADGDVVRVAAGTYLEDLDFLGKAIAVVGAGAASTVVQGTGTGPVVTFARGEGPASVLDGVTVTGGRAPRGGGILVRAASPTIVRTTLTGNRADFQGSAIYLEDSSAELRNDLIVANRATFPDAGDPHGVEVVRGAPRLLNNTIADGDSNGIIFRGSDGAVVSGNVIAFNGSARGGARGRGICDFGRSTVIRHNLFFSNRRGALLVDRDYARIERAERAIDDPRVADNRSGSPRFVDRRRGDYRLRRGSRAIDLGDPSPELADLDGTRNDAGHLGGPLAAP